MSRKTRIAGAVLAVVTAGAAATWTTRRLSRRTDAADSPDPAGQIPKDPVSVGVESVDLRRAPVGDVVRILLACVVAAAGLRFLYQLSWNPHPFEFTHSSSLLDAAQASWNPVSPISPATIMALAGIQLSTTSALFIATAFTAAIGAEPPLMEARRVATQRLALAVAIVGGTAFLLLIPDAAASNAPLAMVCLCLFAVGVNVVMAAINGPRATDHERWAASAVTTLTHIEAQIERVRANIPPTRSMGGHESSSSRPETPCTSSDLQMLMKMVKVIRWPAIALTFIPLAAVSVSLWYIWGAPAGLAFMVGNVLAHLFTVLTIIATMGTPRLTHGDRRPALTRLLKSADTAMYMLFPIALVLIVSLTIATKATTVAELSSVLIGGVLELIAISAVFRIITRDPLWKLGGLQRLKRQIQKQEQWNREHATWLSEPTPSRRAGPNTASALPRPGVSGHHPDTPSVSGQVDSA